MEDMYIELFISFYKLRLQITDIYKFDTMQVNFGFKANFC